MNKRNFVAASVGLAGLWTATTSSHAAPVGRTGVLSGFGFGPLFFGYAVILKSHLVKVCEKIQ